MCPENDQIELLLLDVKKNISENVLFLKGLDLDEPQDAVQDMDHSVRHDNETDDFEEL